MRCLGETVQTGSGADGPRFLAHARVQRALGEQRDDADHAQQRRHGKSRLKTVLAVQDLDVQRQGVGLAADVPRHHRHGAELAQGPGRTQDHAVEHAIADARQGDPPKHLPTARAQRHCGQLLLVTLRFHQRNQLAGHERQGHKRGGEHDAGYCEDHADVALHQPRPEPALGAKQQDEHQARHHRRDRQRQIDERDQEHAAAELKACNGPGRRDTKHRIEGHGQQRNQQREANGAPGFRVRDGLDIRRPARAEGLVEHGGQRHGDHQPQPGQGQGDQKPAQGAALGGQGTQFTG